MNYLILIAATWLLATINPLLAALVWTVAVSCMHAHEESKGNLANYFSQINKLERLARVGPWLGFLLIVFPALALQSFAAWNAFPFHSGASITELAGTQIFWLCVLIGARIGDALFSHAIPFVNGKQPNPGAASALVYVADSLLLIAIFAGPIGEAARFTVVSGFALGAGFFAAVQPLLLPPIDKSLRLVDGLIAQRSKSKN